MNLDSGTDQLRLSVFFFTATALLITCAYEEDGRTDYGFNWAKNDQRLVEQTVLWLDSLVV